MALCWRGKQKRQCRPVPCVVPCIVPVALLNKVLFERLSFHRVVSFLPLVELKSVRLVCTAWKSARMSSYCFDDSTSRYIGISNVHKLLVTSDIRAFTTTLTSRSHQDLLAKHAAQQMPCLETLSIKCIYFPGAGSFWSCWPASLRELSLDVSYMLSLGCGPLGRGTKIPEMTSLERLSLVCSTSNTSNLEGANFAVIARCLVEAATDVRVLVIQSAFEHHPDNQDEHDIVQIINTRACMINTRARDFVFDRLELPRAWIYDVDNALTVSCRVLVLQCFLSSQEVHRKRQPGSCPDMSRVHVRELIVQGSCPDVRLPAGLEVLRWEPPSRCFIRYIDSQFVFDANLFAECELSLKVLDFGHQGFDREVLRFDVTGLKRLQRLEHVYTNQWTRTHLKLLLDCLGPQTVVHVEDTMMCALLITDILESRIKRFQGRVLSYTWRTQIERERAYLRTRGYSWEQLQSAFSIEWQDINDMTSHDMTSQVAFSRIVS